MEDGEVTVKAPIGWRKRRTGERENAEKSSKKSRVESSELSSKLLTALESASAASDLLTQLRRRGKMSKVKLATMFEALVEMLVSKKAAEIVWPEELFKFLMSRSIVGRWDSVVDLLIERSDLPAIDLALRRPGIDAANLCRLLRFVATLPNAAIDSKKTDKRHLLLQIVSLSVRDEDAMKVLKTIPVAEAVNIIETLLTLLKDEANLLDEESEINDSSAPVPMTLPHASILHWITLLVDSHFLDFIMGDDEKYFQLLADLETFTHDLEGYFQTREALDGLLGDMKERMALYGGGGALKLAMGPKDDYCIQVIEF